MNTNLLSRKSPSSAPYTPPVSTARKKKRHVWKVVLALIALFLVIAGVKVAQFAAMISAGKKMVPPPTTVTSAEVKKADWQPMSDRGRFDFARAGRDDQRGTGGHGDRDQFPIGRRGEEGRRALEDRRLRRSRRSCAPPRRMRNWRRASSIAPGTCRSAK